MIVIPAIDIKNGKVVRLYRGQFDKEKIYSEDPAAVAREWESKGAKLLHVIDLDGAISGEQKNLETIKNIAKAVSIPIEVGGGIRTELAIDNLIDQGAGRVILGTSACENDEFIKRVLQRFGEKIVVSIDSKDGMVVRDGWIRFSDVASIELVKKLELFGLKVLIYTDITRDGTLEGPNLEELEEILSVRKNVMVIASGGVSNLNDLLEIKKLEPQGLAGVIVGKALYEKTIDLEEAIKKC